MYEGGEVREVVSGARSSGFGQEQSLTGCDHKEPKQNAAHTKHLFYIQSNNFSCFVLFGKKRFVGLGKRPSGRNKPQGQGLSKRVMTERPGLPKFLEMPPPPGRSYIESRAAI